MTETGKILWFSHKGYGFILRDGLMVEDPNSQIYVHISAINQPNLQTIRPQQRVSFEIIPGKKKGTLELMNVQFID